MVKSARVLFMVLCVVCLFGAKAGASAQVGIITGSERGTYFQFGLDLQQLLGPRGILLSVYPSSGSIENIHAVYKRPRTQLGIVQSDVLAFVARVQSNPTLRNVADKIKLVFPLYNEEIHLVAREGVRDFDDLAGRRVAIGQEESGTYLTARLLFEISGLQPKEMVTVGTGEALSLLKAGEVDAMFYVAGYPVRLFEEGVSREDGLNLIPITNGDVVEFYPASTIPGEAYPWVSGPVPTVTVKATLVSFDFRGENCVHVGNVAAIVYQNLDWLKQEGHPKWKSVDLDHELRGWEQYGCVEQALRKVKKTPPQRAQEVNPVLEAIKEILQ